MNAIADRHTRSATVLQGYLMPEVLMGDTEASSEPKKLFKRKIRRAFNFVDEDGSGDIDRQEFRKIMALIKVKLEGLDIIPIFDFMDRDDNGVITIEDMEAFLEFSFPPKHKIRCEMLVNLGHPKRFLQYHTWRISKRPLGFTLVPGVNNSRAHFKGSSDPVMHSKIEKYARLTFINTTNVAESEFVDIQYTLAHSEYPMTLEFQSLDTIERAKVMDKYGRFHKASYSFDTKLTREEREMFNRPDVAVLNPAISTEFSKQHKHRYHNHCRHCPSEDAWYLDIHLFMEDENYSFFSKCITWLLMFLIALSTATYVFETLPRSEEWMGWELLEGIVSIAFTLEFVIRISSCRDIVMYMNDPVNLIDFCAVIPYWIEHLTVGMLNAELLRVVRVIRLLRLVRLLKSNSMQQTLTIFKQTIISTVHWLCLFLLVAIIGLIVFASSSFVFEGGIAAVVGICDELTHYTTCDTSESTSIVNFTNNITLSADDCVSPCIEYAHGGCCSFNQFTGDCLFYNSTSIRNSTETSDFAGLCWLKEINLRQDGLQSPFHEIPTTFWYSSVTMMMVGYGEYAPVGETGRFIAAWAGLMGLFGMAMSVIVVGFHFTVAMVATRYERLPRRIEKHIKSLGKNAIPKLLESVNGVCGLKLFMQEEELVFLSTNNQINTQKKLEHILSYKDGWAYLPYAYDDAPGLPRISQFKLFVLYAIFGRKLQKQRKMRRKEEKFLNQLDSPRRKKPKFNFLLSSSKRKFWVSDDVAVQLKRVSPRTNCRSPLVMQDFRSPRKLEEFCEDDSCMDVLDKPIRQGNNLKGSPQLGGVHEGSSIELLSLEKENRLKELKNCNSFSSLKDLSPEYTSKDNYSNHLSNNSSSPSTEVKSPRDIRGSYRKRRRESGVKILL